MTKLSIQWEKYDHKPTVKDEDDDDEEKSPSIIQTPFGTFRVDDSMNPFKQFNFWLANTNFKLTKAHPDIINSINGVEALIFLTRYRFIVCIGKMFNEQQVKNDIDRILTNSFKYTFFSKQELNDKISELQTKLDSTHKLWSIYAFPNGNLDFVADNDLDNVLEKYKLYKQSQSLSCGQIIISQELQKKIKNAKKNK